MSLELQYGVVVIVCYLSIQLWALGMWVYDCWRERWNEKFRHTEDLATEDLEPEQYAKSDYHAFAATLVDTIPIVSWPRMFGYPFVGGVIVASVWLLLTVVAEVLV